MTPAGPARPRSAMELLFGLGEDAPGALADRILSAGAGGNLGSALENLPKVTREAAVREVTAEAAGLLDVNLIDVLVAGWREHHELTSAARRTLAVPGSTELVSLASHRVTAEQQPYVTVLVDGHRVATVELGLSLVFGVTALLAGISGGKLVALHAGRCEVTAALAIQGYRAGNQASLLRAAWRHPARAGDPAAGRPRLPGQRGTTGRRGTRGKGR
jgi:hypothetical protein